MADNEEVEFLIALKDMMDGVDDYLLKLYPDMYESLRI